MKVVLLGLQGCGPGRSLALANTAIEASKTR